MAVTASTANAASQPRAAASLVLFVCTNGTREQPERALGRDWPVEVERIALPCTGKLQPEHLLKAFEAGADLVCVVGCEPDNCHCLEGSRRAARRVAYVQGLLDEAGVGGERLLMLYLPGTAPEDLEPAPGGEAQGLEAIRSEIAARLEAVGPNPLRAAPSPRRETE